MTAPLPPVEALQREIVATSQIIERVVGPGNEDAVRFYRRYLAALELAKIDADIADHHSTAIDPEDHVQMNRWHETDGLLWEEMKYARAKLYEALQK